VSRGTSKGTVKNKDVTFTALQNEDFTRKMLTSFSRSALPERLHTEFDSAKARQGVLDDQLEDDE